MAADSDLIFGGYAAYRILRVTAGAAITLHGSHLPSRLSVA